MNEYAGTLRAVEETEELAFGSVVTGWLRCTLLPGQTAEVLVPVTSEPGDRVSVHAAVRLFTAGEIDDRAYLSYTWRESGNEFDAAVEVSYASMFQPVYLYHPHSGQQSRAEIALTVTLSPTSRSPVSLFCGESAGELGPALLTWDERDVASDAPAAQGRLLGALWSERSIQPFNWHIGCVLDGMVALERAGLAGLDHHAALIRHIRTFWTEDGAVHYAGPLGDLVENQIVGLEILLPYAALQQVEPENRAFELFDQFVEAHRDEEWIVLDRGSDAEGRPLAETAVTIEGCYTVAYPMALRAAHAGNSAMARGALNNLVIRSHELEVDGTVYQRRWGSKAPRQGNWSRAVAWFLLGVGSTLEVLQEQVSDIDDAAAGSRSVAAAVQRVVEVVLATERTGGGWHCYLTEPETGIDTSGSAGIAAGLVCLYRVGVVTNASVVDAAQRALRAVLEHVGPDGVLGAVAQLNRGGEEFQREPFRVHGQYAMGLCARLIAELSQF